MMYVVGGISDEGLELCSAEVFDPLSHRWCPLPTMATRRAYVGVAALNNCIYAVGGWNEALGSLETVEKYCPEEVGGAVLLLLLLFIWDSSLSTCFPIHLSF